MLLLKIANIKNKLHISLQCAGLLRKAAGALEHKKKGSEKDHRHLDTFCGSWSNNRFQDTGDEIS